MRRLFFPLNQRESALDLARTKPTRSGRIVQKFSHQRRKATSRKKAYEKKLKAQLDEWGKEIEKLKLKADKAKAEQQLKYYKILEELKAKQKTAAKKLQELKDTGEDAWEDLKTGIEKAWNALGEAVKAAVSKFR